MAVVSKSVLRRLQVQVSDKEILDWLETRCSSLHDFVISLSEGETLRSSVLKAMAREQKE